MYRQWGRETSSDGGMGCCNCYSRFMSEDIEPGETSRTTESSVRVRGRWADGVLAVRPFRLLLAGQFTSTAGDYCYAVALPWLVLSSHGGPGLLGVVLACYGMPRTLLMPAGGLLADRLGPQTLMMVADILRCALVAALAALAAINLAPLLVIAPIAALLGAGEGLFIPASYAVMPTLLSPEVLQAGNAISSAAMQAATFVGPVLGGTLVVSGGPTAAFAADATSFAVSALTIALIRRHQVRAPGERPGETAGLGNNGNNERAALWPLVRQARVLQILLAVVVVANLTLGGTFQVALPALARSRFGAAGYAALLASLGAGSAGGTLLAARGRTLERPAFAACAGFLVAACAVSMVPFLGGLPGAASAMLIFGIGYGFGNVILITALQRWVPAPLLGRVMGLVMLASLGSFPISAAVVGLVVRAVGPALFFPVVGAILAIAVIGAFTQQKIRVFGMPDSAPFETSPEPM
jgi:predicted MFS family arabinose efflux permease